MAQTSNKNISSRTKRSEFDTEEKFQDTSRPNAKVSEPARTTSNETSHKDVKKGGATPSKKR